MIQHLFSGLPFFICLFWLVLFIIEYRNANPAKKFLTYFLLACTILYFSHAVYFHQDIYLFSMVESIYAFCTLAVYPLYYLYICKLTGEKQFTIKSFWVLLPAVIISLISIFLYGMMSESERIGFVENEFFTGNNPVHEPSFAEKGQMYRIAAMKIVFIIQLIPVSYFGYKKLSLFNKEINNYYADIENKTLAPIQNLLLLFILFAFFSAVANQLGRDFFIQESGLLAIPSLIFGSMLFSISYIGYKQDFTALDFYKDSKKSPQEESIPNFSSANGILKERLQYLIEEQQLFKQKDLHISDVALQAGSNRTYVSNYINKELNLSFSDYINSRRIKYAQSLMLLPGKSLSLNEISDLSGFANEASFYRNFKKIAGTTPSEWLKQKQAKDKDDSSGS